VQIKPAHHDMIPRSLTLAGLVRAHLQRIAARAETITYQSLATEMQVKPPNTIHQLTTVLEDLMREDAAAHRPLIAALVVSKRPPFRPGRGFFQCATHLGRFSGIDSEAQHFHARELAEAQRYWSELK
jgi:hypothetical protein